MELFDVGFTNSRYVASGGMLLHEMGHALGLTHEPGCYGPCYSSMCTISTITAGSQEPSGFFVDDQDFVRLKYGNFASTRDHLESNNGTTWWALPSSVVPSHQPGAGVSDSATGGPYMSFYKRTTTGRYNYRYRWVSGTMGWEYWGYDYNPGTGAIGSAYNYPAGRAYFVQQIDETASNADKQLQWTSATGGGLVTYYTDTSGTATERHGVAAAYDPNEAKLVAVSRAELVTNVTRDWQILFHIIDPVSNQVLNTIKLGTWADATLAFDTPSITCGAASIYYNCMVVWADAGDPNHGLGVNTHVMRSMQFRVVNQFGLWTLVVAPSIAIGTGNGYVAYSRPTVTYKGSAGSSSAFVVAWSVPHTGSTNVAQYTMRKSATATSWSGLTYHAPNGKSRHSPVLGAQNGYAELLRSWRP